jgi:hypothetical protein
MTDIPENRLPMMEKAIVLAELIEASADDDIVGMTMKLLAMDYLVFCKQVGLDPVKPMSTEKIDQLSARGVVN